MTPSAKPLRKPRAGHPISGIIGDWQVSRVTVIQD